MTVTREQVAVPQNESKTTIAAAQSSMEVNNMGERKSPLPEIKIEKKIPTMKAGAIGMSMRQSMQKPVKEEKVVQTFSSDDVNSKDYENYIFNEKDLSYYWRDFAHNQLPPEEKANASRMMNMSPRLLNDTTFEILVDNEMVESYMQKLLPQIQGYLREQLHNQKITMTVRVSAQNEVVRAYSQTERFVLMCKRNPKLLRLKEVFGLEFN